MKQILLVIVCLAALGSVLSASGKANPRATNTSANVTTAPTVAPTTSNSSQTNASSTVTASVGPSSKSSIPTHSASSVSTPVTFTNPNGTTPLPTNTTTPPNGAESVWRAPCLLLVAGISLQKLLAAVH